MMSYHGDGLSDPGGTDEDGVHYSDEEEHHLAGRPPARSAPQGLAPYSSWALEGGGEGGVGVASTANIPLQDEQQPAIPDFWGRDNSWKDLPVARLDAPRFCSQLKMFTSATVTISVGPEKINFKLPKDLLCYHSRYFDRCLNGGFKEATEKKIALDEDSVVAFQLMVQWIFTGTLALPWHLNLTGQVGAILEFLKLADKLDLLGSLCSVTDTLRNLLVTSRSRLRTRTSCSRTWGAQTPCRGHPSTNPVWQAGTPLTYCVDNSVDPDPLQDNSITSEHLRIAFDLPAGHEARTILVNACVSSFLLTGAAGSGWGPPFKFEEELRTIDGFSVELLEGIRSAVNLLPLQNSQNALIIDPLTGTNLNI